MTKVCVSVVMSQRSIIGNKLLFNKVLASPFEGQDLQNDGVQNDQGNSSMLHAHNTMNIFFAFLHMLKNLIVGCYYTAHNCSFISVVISRNPQAGDDDQPLSDRGPTNVTVSD